MRLNNTDHIIQTADRLVRKFGTRDPEKLALGDRGKGRIRDGNRGGIVDQDGRTCHDLPYGIGRDEGGDPSPDG